MPRKARIDAPGALHHVIVRGIERRKIFRSDYDRQNLVNRLSELIPETGTDCLAWALIPNHFHLLLRTGSVPIAVLMRRLLTGYAGWFNRKYKRHGQLFQNRYKSILCQEDPYLKKLVQYIHLNPLRAGLVADMDDLDKYPWCGHSAVMNKKVYPWQNIDYVYGLFSDQKRTARKKYRVYIEEGISAGKQTDLTGGGLLRSIGGWAELKSLRKASLRVKGDERILGDSDFVTDVLKAADESLEQQYHLKISGYDFNRVVQRVAQLLDMTLDEVTAYGKSPQTVKARALLCFWAQRKLGMTTVEIAGKLRRASQQ
jgi:REP element-mobilizing transposase RayT